MTMFEMLYIILSFLLTIAGLFVLLFASIVTMNMWAQLKMKGTESEHQEEQKPVYEWHRRSRRMSA